MDVIVNFGESRMFGRRFCLTKPPKIIIKIKIRQKSKYQIPLCYPTIPSRPENKSTKSKSRDNPGKYSTLVLERRGLRSEDVPGYTDAAAVCIFEELIRLVPSRLAEAQKWGLEGYLKAGCRGQPFSYAAAWHTHSHCLLCARLNPHTCRWFCSPPGVLHAACPVAMLHPSRGHSPNQGGHHSTVSRAPRAPSPSQHRPLGKQLA